MPFVCTSPVDGYMWMETGPYYLEPSRDGQTASHGSIHPHPLVRPFVQPLTNMHTLPKTFRLSYTPIRPSALGNVPTQSSLG